MGMDLGRGFMEYGKLIEPAPVPFSFGAPGWYVLGIFCLLVILFVLWLMWRHHVKKRYRAEALQWLSIKEQSLTRQKNYNALVYETSMLLKRIAMSKYGRSNVAGKRGTDWTSYINSTWKAKAFDKQDEALLYGDIYSVEAIEPDKATAFVNKAKQWIKQHKV